METVVEDAARALPPWLRHQLKRREWTQAEFARRVKASSGAVSMWLSGERVPDPASIDRIADVLNVDLDLVLALAGHRPIDVERDPDDPAEVIASLGRRVTWNQERFETAEAIMRRWIEFDREKAKEG